MKRSTLAFSLLAAGLWACASSRLEHGGTNTNWLVRCDDDSVCDEGACECGLCTKVCEGADACAEVPGSSCLPKLEALGCGDDGERVCARRCETDGDCDVLTDGTCVGGICVAQASAAPAESDCDPLQPRPQPIALGELVVVARADDGTLYVVDRATEGPVAGEARVFVSQGQELMRRDVLGSGEGGDLLLYTFEDDGRERTLAIDLMGEEWRVAVADGEVERDFAEVLAQGEALERLPDEVPEDYRLVNLSGEITVEYAAEDSAGDAFLVVLRPEDDWSYDDFEVYYGPEDRVAQRSVDEVLRQRDGGSTTIAFRIDEQQVTASFPFGGEPRLSTPEGDRDLLALPSSAAASLRYRCLDGLP